MCANTFLCPFFLRPLNHFLLPNLGPLGQGAGGFGISLRK
uniref:Uncharacterized protein n=1 Tax=Anguilla anguilla TaxID=7936 RepID=A0A0E9Q326_ANGAN